MKRGLIFIMWALIASQKAAAQSAAGSLLDIPVSVRAMGLGEAYTAADDDVFGIHYNPAIVLTGGQLAFLYQRGLEARTADFVGNTGAIAAGAPTSWGKVAGSFVYFDAGTIALNDTAGNSRTVTAEKDMLATVSSSFSPAEALSIGGNFKILRSQLLDEFTGTAYLFDVGALYKPASWMNVGFAAQNMGTGISYAGTEESLPTTFRGGVAFKQRYLAHRITYAFDMMGRTDEATPKEHVGIEYWYANTLALRAGYKFGYDTQNVSFGAGFAMENVTVDMAMAPSSVTGTTTQISVTLRF